jgi:hypothetical protein
MFIPPGEPVYEGLATSFVLVDALVVDLCEGGFSGFVEVLLRDTDSFVVIANGNVAGAFDKLGNQTTGGKTISHARTTVEQLAERSRQERGRVSIYGYSAATASAVAGRLNARTLYEGLSTEFTDLEKMLSKLVRESDREWFIEINSENGMSALLHMRDSECRTITSTGEADSGALQLASNPVLGRLIYECNRAGGTFDVYFTQPDAESVDEPEPPTDQQPSEAPQFVDAVVTQEPVETQPGLFLYETSESLTSSAYPVGSEPDPQLPILSNPGEVTIEQVDSGSATAAADAGQTSYALPAEVATPGPTGDLIEQPDGGLAQMWDEITPASADDEAMAEIKRLMGETARVIEEAAQAVGRPDSFSMSLRAAQLKITEHFPFLDPFAGDFEYLTGEIVFVGRASAEEFVVGLTEALKLAIASVMRSTAFPERFRSYVTEDLQKLLVRERAPFEAFGLDQVIHQLLTDDQ